MKKNPEDCSHRTQSDPIQSMDGSNPCPTLACPTIISRVIAMSDFNTVSIIFQRQIYSNRTKRYSRWRYVQLLSRIFQCRKTANRQMQWVITVQSISEERAIVYVLVNRHFKLPQLHCRVQ